MVGGGDAVVNASLRQRVALLGIAVVGIAAGIMLYVLSNGYAAVDTDAGVDPTPEGSASLWYRSDDRAFIAIVIDDLGYARAGTERILALNYPITLSVLPWLPNTLLDYNRAVESGHEAIAHLPMEPHSGSVSPGEGAILTSMSEEEIAEAVIAVVGVMPAVRYMNNHMGSLATEDPRVMFSVLSVLKDYGMGWLDSSTSSRSVGPGLARELGLECVSNDIFVDNVKTVDAILKMLEQAVAIALLRGYAVAIGHVGSSMAEALEVFFPSLASRNVTPVTLSQLMAVLLSGRTPSTD